MPKKKKKKSGGAKKGETKKKEPTEEQLFQRQVEALKGRLEAATLTLSELTEKHAWSGEILGQERASKESCLSHLQRKLKAEFQRSQAIKDRLQTERDLVELLERRALGKLAATERSGEATRSLFLQKKVELEGKLSLLEELRLERASRAAHLRRTEALLEERSSALRAKGREEDSSQVDGLLSSRAEFLRLCQEVRQEFRSAFELRLPVHAKGRLEDEVRLRARCGASVGALLQEQGRSRRLKAARRAADLEEEVHACAERKRDRLEGRIEHILQARHLPSTGSEGASDGGVAPRWACLDVERCGLSDERAELSLLLLDQDRHRKSLDRQMAVAVDTNGALMSGLFRAGKLVASRTDPAPGLDRKLLLQMRVLMDLSGSLPQ